MKRVLITLTTLPLTLGLLSGPAGATSPPSTAPPDTRQTSTAKPAATPKQRPTKPQYDYGTAIRETVWVQAPDLDDNGRSDRVAVDVIRPRELDGTSRIPVVMDASPYYSCCGRGNESERKLYDARGNPEKFPLFYDNYFVPRGYAYVAVDMAGTSRSAGCTDQGADSDIESVRAVIDWLNGRARAVDRSGKNVQATWSNGKTGMIGKSYDGTLANGVAATGVEGLETIVPIAAISSWYDYDRYQGLPFSYDYPTYLSEYVAGERSEDIDCSERLAQMSRDDADETGAYTDFWEARDYRDGDTRDVSKVDASVFVVHGLQDFNVKTPNFSRWWKALGEHDVDRKMWLTRVGHADPFDSDRKAWVRTLHRWFDHELMGVRNGVDREPAVRAEVAPGDWATASDWPAKGRMTRLRPHRGGRLAVGRPARGDADFVNDPSQDDAAAIAAGDNPSRLLFTTDRLARKARLSGTPRVRLDVGHGADTGQVGVLLVDYGKSRRIVEDNDGVHNLDTESCWGQSTVDDDACYIDTAHSVERTPLQVLSRGWARLDDGDQSGVTIDMTSNDVVIPAGHRIGLVVVGASRDWVVTLDEKPTRYTVGLRASSLQLPLRGLLDTADGARGRTLPRLADIPETVLADHDDRRQVPLG